MPDCLVWCRGCYELKADVQDTEMCFAERPFCGLKSDTNNDKSQLLGVKKTYLGLVEPNLWAQPRFCGPYPGFHELSHNQNPVLKWSTQNHASGIKKADIRSINPRVLSTWLT